LRIPLLLRYTNSSGNKVDEPTTSEDVSVSGFLCVCKAELSPGSIVEVFLTNPRQQYVGSARNVHSDSKTAPLCHYGFRFIEKTGAWVLD
jgi:hypothetical protein